MNNNWVINGPAGDALLDRAAGLGASWGFWNFVHFSGKTDKIIIFKQKSIFSLKKMFK